MPNIFDNIEQPLLPALRGTIANNATSVDILSGTSICAAGAVSLTV
jgi:hypothetical protein